MTERERMNKGLIYNPGDSEIMKEQERCLELLYDFNAIRPSESEKREELLKKMFGSIGKGCYIEPPFRANWGGRHVFMGNFVIVPGVTIGENTVIGAGSVVTKNIPANVVAYGNPCKVIREINEHDREFFYKKDKIDWENL